MKRQECFVFHIKIWISRFSWNVGRYGKTRHDNNPLEPKHDCYIWEMFWNSLQPTSKLAVHLFLTHFTFWQLPPGPNISFRHTITPTQLPILMSQDTFLASVTAEASMPHTNTAAQAVHCTIPGSSTYLDYKSNGAPWSVQCGRLAESCFSSVVHNPFPRILSCPLSLITSLSSAFGHCSPLPCHSLFFPPNVHFSPCVQSIALKKCFFLGGKWRVWECGVW